MGLTGKGHEKRGRHCRERDRIQGKQEQKRRPENTEQRREQERERERTQKKTTRETREIEREKQKQKEQKKKEQGAGRKLKTGASPSTCSFVQSLCKPGKFLQF